MACNAHIHADIAQTVIQAADETDFPDDFLNVFHNTMQKVNSIQGELHL